MTPAAHLNIFNVSNAGFHIQSVLWCLWAVWNRVSALSSLNWVGLMVTHFPVSRRPACRYRSISHRHPSLPIFQREWFYYERNSLAINTLCLSMTLGIEFGGFMRWAGERKQGARFEARLHRICIILLILHECLMDANSRSVPALTKNCLVRGL